MRREERDRKRKVPHAAWHRVAPLLPALLHSPSSGLLALVHSSAKLWTALTLLMSKMWYSTRGGGSRASSAPLAAAALISSTASRAASSLRQMMCTSAPLTARRMATPLPMPELPPVTMNVLPRRDAHSSCPSASPDARRELRLEEKACAHDRNSRNRVDVCSSNRDGPRFLPAS